MEGARTAIERTEESIERTKREDVKVESVEKKKRRKREWYERYRWFVSSEGHLVIGGRDARSNESIVKRHLEDGDIHVHADMTGAPQVIVKRGAGASESVLHEAGIFAVSFSKAWKMQVGSLDAYWVHPEQVTKDAPSGEFLTTGAFAIKGKKNYLKKLPVEVAIGVYDKKVMCGPVTAVEKNCESSIIVVPGSHSKEDVAKRLQKMLEWDDLDEIVQALPPGTCSIKEK
jgi:predicted ribosome quality control (RQC) complex YloA/Tae2 family protein